MHVNGLVGNERQNKTPVVWFKSIYKCKYKSKCECKRDEVEKWGGVYLYDMQRLTLGTWHDI